MLEQDAHSARINEDLNYEAKKKLPQTMIQE
ncbi:hypothetical protein V1477_005691, partial [Vespula maculifrons]